MERDINITGTKKLALFVSELVREGVTFNVIERGNPEKEEYVVRLTGGY